MAIKPIRLVVMRLADMHKEHPDQVVMECFLCHEPVGVYPSGQKVLRFAPRPVEVVCQVCAFARVAKGDVVKPAGSLDEIMREVRSSRDVGRA